jgi:4-hydroxythreonine-4-phosphate dehydrogenase
VKPVIAITTGEPAGVGPEISIRSAWELRAEYSLVLIGDIKLLSKLAANIDSAIKLTPITIDSLQGVIESDRISKEIRVIDCPLAIPAETGHLDLRNAHAVLRMLDIAIAGALQGQFDAIVTAPLQKSTINDAGIPFTGHTEYLAEKMQVPQVVMMLVGSVEKSGATFPIRVALATTHLPLKNVADAITFDGLMQTITIIDHDLRSRFGLQQPRILVTGLNPHAGEGGYLGREEIDVITPAINAAKRKGINVSGPYPADTLFQPSYLEKADCVLAMYHDQGLPVLKHASFGSGVNITLGLPVIRTSVDHGTALDQAVKGLGYASHRSMVEAVMLAAQMAVQSQTAAHS